MKSYDIALFPGDGIGSEIIAEGAKVIRAASEKIGFEINYTEYPFGADHYLKTGEILPDSAIKEFKGQNAVYFGAVGDPRVKPGILEQEMLLKMRFEMDQYINLRPCRLYPNIRSPLADAENIDIVLVRENIEDFYINKGFVSDGDGNVYQDRIVRSIYEGDISLTANIRTDGAFAVNMGVITQTEAERTAEYAFELAKKQNRKKVTCITKMNAIPQMYSVWENAFRKTAKKYGSIETNTMNVDNAAMQLIKNPKDFDVIMSPNLFGDILSDLVSGICGGLGFGASGNVNPHGTSMFEPLHGSAPKYKGTNEANPMATILAGALMLDSIGEPEAAETIRTAVETALRDGLIKTKDMGGSTGTNEVGDVLSGLIKGEYEQ